MGTNQSYFTIPIDFVELFDDNCPIDLFLRYRGRSLVPVLKKGERLDRKSLTAAKAIGIQHLHIPTVQSSALAQICQVLWRRTDLDPKLCYYFGSQIASSYMSAILENPEFVKEPLDLPTVYLDFLYTCLQVDDRDALLGLIPMAGSSYLVKNSMYSTLATLDICARLGHGRAKTNNFALAAFFKDVGMNYLPFNAYSIPGALDESQMKEVRKHTFLSRGFVAKNNAADRELLQAILDHHERADGSGYPVGKTLAEISEGARLIGLVDVVTAMWLKGKLSKEDFLDSSWVKKVAASERFDSDLVDVYSEVLKEAEFI